MTHDDSAWRMMTTNSIEAVLARRASRINREENREGRPYPGAMGGLSAE